MSQESNDKQHQFEQKMRDQGADGFADGPCPWETWDESGHQANNRVWEGSARRVNGKYRKHSLGYRILSVLALMALTTLLVVVIYWFKARKANLPRRAAAGVNALLHTTILQVVLGVSTLLLAVPLFLGVAHQAVAMLLLTVAMFTAHALRRAAKPHT